MVLSPYWSLYFKCNLNKRIICYFLPSAYSEYTWWRGQNCIQNYPKWMTSHRRVLFFSPRCCHESSRIVPCNCENWKIFYAFDLESKWPMLNWLYRARNYRLVQRFYVRGNIEWRNGWDRLSIPGIDPDWSLELRAKSFCPFLLASIFYSFTSPDLLWLREINSF